MSAARPLPTPVDPSTMDHFVHLRVDWQGYRQLLALRGESSVPRITYLKGVVELMSPSRYHELDKKRFARLLETWSEVAGVPLEGYGSWALEDEKEDRAAEPDECYTVRRVVKPATRCAAKFSAARSCPSCRSTCCSPACESPIRRRPCARCARR